MSRRLNARALLSLALLLLGPVSAHALRKIPDTYGTLDAAMAACASVDTIEITSGTSYTGFSTPANKTVYVFASTMNQMRITGKTSFRKGTLKNLNFEGAYLGDKKVLLTSTGVGESILIENCTVQTDSLRSDSEGIVAALGTITMRNVVVDRVNYPISPSFVTSNAVITAEDCRFTTGGGILMDSQTASLRRCILAKAYTGGGAGLAFGGGSVTKVIQTIIHGFDTVFSSNCPSDSVYYNILDGYTTLGCTLNGTNNLLATDPLFCEARESSVKQYSLRIDSPAIATNNAWNKTVGNTDGVQCAWGTLARDATVASNSSIIVLEDLTIPSGKNLVLKSGVTFSTDGVDQSSSGNDHGENEIIVNGRLEAIGSNPSKVTFRSTAGSPAANDWYGIRGTGKILLSFAKVQYAQIGVNPGGTDSVKIDKCTFDHNGTYDIYAGSAPNPLLVTSNVLTVENIGMNLICSDFSYSTVSNNKLTAVDSGSLAGIRIEGAGGSPTGGITVTADTVTDFSGGAGIQVMNSTPTFTNCRATGNKYGFHVQGGAPLIGTTSSSSDNAILSNTRGIFVQGPGPSTCYACSTICPVVRNNLIDSNTYGIVSERAAASVDAGTDTLHKGLNTITNSGTYCIWNHANSSCGYIQAVGDYFGTCYQVCVNGQVNIDHPECSTPASLRPGLVTTEPAAPAWTIRVRPNPVEATTTVSFATLKPSTHVDLSVFDVSGRLVRNLASGDYSAGTFDVFWDGKSSDGSAVPEGIYFVRMLEHDGTRHTAKIMVLR